MAKHDWTPSPGQYIPSRSLIGDLKAGTAVSVAGGDKSEEVQIAGSSRGRIRFKCTTTGTLKLHFMSADGSTEYTSANPADVAIAANTENFLQWDSYGEALAKVIFTPSGTGAITYCDFGAI